MVQWLRLSTSSGRGMGSIPGQGTKIPHATWHSKKKKVYNNKKETKYTEFSPYGDREEEDKDGKKVQNERKGKEEK